MHDVIERAELAQDVPSPALGMDEFVSAFRTMDPERMPSILAAARERRLPPKAMAAISSPEHLSQFLSSSPAGSPSSWRKIWRRLDGFLRGELDEASILSGLGDNEKASLNSMIRSVIQQRRYHRLAFPTSREERVRLVQAASREFGLSWTDAAAYGTASHKPNPDNVQWDPVTPNTALARHPVNAAVVAYVAQALGLPMEEGEPEAFLKWQGKEWRPVTCGEIISGIADYRKCLRVAERVSAAAYDYLEQRHGIRRAVSSGAVKDYVGSIRLTEIPSDTELEAGLAPFVPALLERMAMERGHAALSAMAKAGKIRFFGSDSAEPQVADALRKGDIESAYSLLRHLCANRVRNALSGAVGSDDISAVTAMAAGGDGRPARGIRSLMPTLGSTLPSAARNAAISLGADTSGAGAFSDAIVSGEAAAAQRAAEEARRQQAWEASLLDTAQARAVLGATPTEFRRWLDEGRIPVARRVRFHRWGRTLSATEHDPEVLAGLAEKLQEWRAQHALEVSRRRSEAARAAARTRETNPKPASPEMVRKRRLTALLRSLDTAGSYHGTNLATTLPVVMPDMDISINISILYRVPDVVSEAVDFRRKPLAGQARKAILEELRAAWRDASDTAAQGLHAVCTAWQERCASIGKGFPEAGASAFARQLSREVKEALGGTRWDPTTRHVATDRLRQLLDRALVDAVNAHAREWGVDDLREKSGMANYAAMFPEARAMRRRLVLHLGPTNSGKTHAAMDWLAAASSGAYLAPLRLMALEGFDRLIGERGVPTDMVTGEEERRTDGARHVSSTIEMADLATPVDVAVIDEVQMIADRDRGWAWTQAIAGMPAAEVIMTGSVDALPFVTRIARMTGDGLEVVQFERLVPLEPVAKPVGLSGVRKGDAIIAFSRGEVLRLRDEVAARGIDVATIYGALGPEVRRTQAARFRSGEAQAVVSSDAIAMGLNLPIHRVLFSSIEKFDGVSTRRLTAAEIRQIAGRAGRFGIAERGEVGVLAGVPSEPVTAALREAPKQPKDDRVPVMPPWHAVRAVSDVLATDDLPRILLHVTGTLLKGSDDLRSTSLDDPLAVARAVANSGLTLRERFRYLGVPVDTGKDGNVSHLIAWSRTHASGGTVGAPEFRMLSEVPGTHDALSACERAVKLLTAYLWLAMRWPACYAEYDAAVRERGRLNELIEGALKRRALDRSCRRCGCRLPRRHQFPICDDCYHGGRQDYW